MSKLVRLAARYRIKELLRALDCVFGHKNVVILDDSIIAFSREGREITFERDSPNTFRVNNPRSYFLIPQWRELGRIYAREIIHTIQSQDSLLPPGVAIEFDSSEAHLPLIPPNHNRSDHGKDNQISINVEPRTHELIVQGCDVLNRVVCLNPMMHSGIDRIVRFLACPITYDSLNLDHSLPKQREKKNQILSSIH